MGMHVLQRFSSHGHTHGSGWRKLYPQRCERGNSNGNGSRTSHRGQPRWRGNGNGNQQIDGGIDNFLLGKSAAEQTPPGMLSGALILR